MVVEIGSDVPPKMKLLGCPGKEVDGSMLGILINGMDISGKINHVDKSNNYMVLGS